jgi:MAF protein
MNGVLTMMKKVILASNSPRRRQLMGFLVEEFQVLPVDIDESTQAGENPREYVCRLAAEKMAAAVEENPGAEWVIAADTIVVDESQILGKPADRAHAARILKQLRDRTHRVFTALAVYQAEREKIEHRLVSSDVPMRHYTDREIKDYIASGDPFDKAGAYAIQHRGFHPVQNFQGCFANVMGLPICNLRLVLEDMGCRCDPRSPWKCQAALEYDCQVYESILNLNTG